MPKFTARATHAKIVADPLEETTARRQHSPFAFIRVIRVIRVIRGKKEDLARESRE